MSPDMAAPEEVPKRRSTGDGTGDGPKLGGAGDGAKPGGAGEQ